MREEPVGGLFPSEKLSARALHHQLLEIVLTPVDIIVKSELQVMSELPKADVLLLRRHGKLWSEEQRKVLPDGIRDRQAHHHLLICKFSESLDEAALQQALSYDYFYRQAQKLRVAELQTYVVSAKTPQAALLDKFGYQAAEQPGVYVTVQPMMQKVVLLVLNELRDEPQNEFLRLFASRKWVRKQTIDHVLQQPAGDWPEAVLAVIFGLQRLYQMEETAMNRAMTVEDVMQIGRDLRKQAIASASPEERLAGLAPEERLAGLAPEEMVVMMEQLQALLGTQPAGKPKHRTSSDKR